MGIDVKDSIRSHARSAVSIAASGLFVRVVYEKQKAEVRHKALSHLRRLEENN